MTRDLSASVVSEVTAGTLAPIILCRFEFSTPTHYWTGFGDLVFDGNTYLGAGDFLNVTPAEETLGVKAAGASFSLSSINPATIAAALGEDYQDRFVKMYFGVLDDSGKLIATPYLLFVGRMDVMTIEDGAETATISLTAENRLVDLARPNERRWTKEDQALVSAGDLGFDLVTKMQDFQITWGRG